MATWLGQSLISVSVSVRLPHSEAVQTGQIYYWIRIMCHEFVLLGCTPELCVGKLLFFLSWGPGRESPPNDLGGCQSLSPGPLAQGLLPVRSVRVRVVSTPRPAEERTGVVVGPSL